MELLVVRRRSVVSYLLPALAYLLLTGCNQDVSGYREMIYVFAVLNPGLRQQTVIVDRSHSVDENLPDSMHAASGAEVKLWRENSSDTVVLGDQGRQGFYTDSLVPGRPWVFPCSSYRLSVRLDSFYGATRIAVPGAFAITVPRAGETLHDPMGPDDTISIPVFRWGRSSRAARYRVLAVPHPAPKEEAMFTFPVVVSDTFADVRPYYRMMFDSTGFYTIKVFASDSGRAGLHMQENRVDTIGQNVLADCGARVIDSTLVFYLRLRP
jgi:hypothetical protein